MRWCSCSTFRLRTKSGLEGHRGNSCKFFRIMVARDGVEPLNRRRQPFQVFFEPKPFFNQQLNLSRWPIYCDHSVTSADVRLSVGPNLSRTACRQPVDLRQSQAWTGGSLERKSALTCGWPVIRAQLHAASVQQLWWLTFARYRLFGKVTFLIAFRSPSDLKADLAGRAKCKSLPTHTHSLSQTVAVSPALA
jgi:hypothetical protein